MKQRKTMYQFRFFTKRITITTSTTFQTIRKLTVILSLFFCASVNEGIGYRLNFGKGLFLI